LAKLLEIAGERAIEKMPSNINMGVTLIGG
jgi:hypothetical protein